MFKNSNLMFITIVALLGGIIVSLRPIIDVKREEGQGHITIVINFGFVNVTPISNNDNRPTKPSED